MGKWDEATTQQTLWNLGISSIRQLETEDGILASGREEAYGCVFGRDSLITSLALLSVYERTKNPYFLELVRKVLTVLSKLQGTQVLLESGEEPGKIIHEYRPSGHEHLTKHLHSPWYVYPDNVMRNYDSVDATPLYLMAAHEYLRASGDTQFIETILPSVEAAISWLFEYGDKNGDGFFDYHFDPSRRMGGLRTQSWMDSTESLFYEEKDEAPRYPIAPVEVQAYAFVALCAWGDYFKDRDDVLSKKLHARAQRLKEQFNETFVYRKGRHLRFAFAIDGEGKPLSSMRSSVGHVLYAVYRQGGTLHTIVDEKYIPILVKRLLARDLYVPNAGIRTLSSRSRYFDPQSYHNGTIWPHDTQIIAQGLRHFGYDAEAKMVQSGLLQAYAHFESPLELYTAKRGKPAPYESKTGQRACKTQAWSAASLLAALVDSGLDAIEKKL